MCKNIYIAICMVLFACCNATADKNFTHHAAFVATKEWQEIPQDQSIPAGLHVRIDLTTRKREAKLLDTNSTSESNGEILALKNTKDGQKSKKYSKQTYKELGEFRTDTELILYLIAEYSAIPNITNWTYPNEKRDRQLFILEKFAVICHQIDNGIVFIKANGLDIIRTVITNETDGGVLRAGLRVIGSLVQNNEKAKISVFEQHFVEQLVRILLTTNSDSGDNLVASALHALGGLIRLYPAAQQRFFNASGAKVLFSMLENEHILSIKLKVLALISDLIVERQLNTVSTVELYKSVSLRELLEPQKLCRTIAALLANYTSSFIKRADWADEIVTVMEHCKELCWEIWCEKSMNTKDILQKMNNALLEGTSDDYRTEVAQKFAILSKGCEDHFRNKFAKIEL